MGLSLLREAGHSVLIPSSPPGQPYVFALVPRRTSCCPGPHTGSASFQCSHGPGSPPWREAHHLWSSQEPCPRQGLTSPGQTTRAPGGDTEARLQHRACSGPRVPTGPYAETKLCTYAHPCTHAVMCTHVHTRVHNPVHTHAHIHSLPTQCGMTTCCTQGRL